MLHNRERLLKWGARAIVTAFCALCGGLLIWEMRSAGFDPLQNLAGVVASLVALALLVLMLAIGVEVLEQEYLAGKMTPLLRRLLFWTPRALSILFCAFMSLFALDVFEMGLGFWMTILALLIHLLPVLVLLAALALAWRWEWVGALVFCGFAVWYTGIAWADFPPSVYMALAGVPFLLGVLMLLNWRYHAEVRLHA